MGLFQFHGIIVDTAQTTHRSSFDYIFGFYHSAIVSGTIEANWGRYIKLNPSTMGNHMRDKCPKIKLILICNGYMSEKCSHNQLSMTNYQHRTHFCKIDTEKRPKYVISIFHTKL